MPDYVGDSFRILAQPTDFDNEPLTDADVVAQVTIVNGDDSVTLVDAVAMTYSTEDTGFIYVWRTDGLDPGTYQWETYVAGGDYEKHEFGKIRLKVRPF